jgi:hypothetical protein
MSEALVVAFQKFLFASSLRISESHVLEAELVEILTNLKNRSRLLLPFGSISRLH